MISNRIEEYGNVTFIKLTIATRLFYSGGYRHVNNERIRLQKSKATTKYKAFVLGPHQINTNDFSTRPHNLHEVKNKKIIVIKSMETMIERMQKEKNVSAT